MRLTIGATDSNDSSLNRIPPHARIVFDRLTDQRHAGMIDRFVDRLAILLPGLLCLSLLAQNFISSDQTVPVSLSAFALALRFIPMIADRASRLVQPVQSLLGIHARDMILNLLGRSRGRLLDWRGGIDDRSLHGPSFDCVSFFHNVCVVCWCVSIIADVVLHSGIIILQKS